MIFGRFKKLEQENEKLKKELELVKFQRSIVISLEELIPLSQNERKEYVGRIAVFYRTVFKDKIQHFISEQLKALSRLGLTSQEEMILRSNINCFQLIDEWCESKSNEHYGNLIEAKNQSDSVFDVISNIKEKNNL